MVIAPVSHQKRLHQDATNTIKLQHVIPPREKGFRAVPVTNINLAMFDESDAHQMSDATWAALSELLPGWMGWPLPF